MDGRRAEAVRQWAPQIVYDQFHVMQHATQAVDEVRRAEFFRRGGNRWVNLTDAKRQMLNELFSH